MVARPCHTIPNRKRSNPIPPIHQSLTVNMKKPRTSNEGTKLVVFNLDFHPNALHELPRFLSQKVWQRHGVRVHVVSCQQWQSNPVLVEFQDCKQRDLALNLNGEYFYDRQLRIECFDVTRQKGGPRGKKKQHLCHYFARGNCRFNEGCHNAHGVLDLKLYDDTQLHEERCWYISQIDSDLSSSNLLNLIEFKFKKHHRGSYPEPLITAFYRRQRMGDALIEFGNTTLAEQAYELLNGVTVGLGTLAIHPLASGYQGIFIRFFDHGDPIKIKVPTDTPPVVAPSFPRHISLASSENICEEIDQAQSGQVGTDNTIRHAIEEMNCGKSARQDNSSECTSPTMLEPATANGPTSDTNKATKSRVNEIESLKQACRSVVRNHCLVAKSDQQTIENIGFQHMNSLDSTASDCSGSLQESCYSGANNGGAVADTDKEPTRGNDFHGEFLGIDKEPDRGRDFQQEDAPSSDCSSSVSPFPPHLEAFQDLEKKESEGQQQQSEELQSLESGECPQEETLDAEESQEKETTDSQPFTHIEEEQQQPNDQQPAEIQRDENRLVKLEDSGEHTATAQDEDEESEVLQVDENYSVMSEDSDEQLLFRSNQPLPRATHPVIADDLDLERMRGEMIVLKSEQVEKDQLVQDLKRENEDLKKENIDVMEVDRMRDLIAFLKAEQVERDQLKRKNEELKQENIKIEQQLVGCQEKARRYLERLVGQQMLERKMARVEGELEKVKKENEDLRPKLQCKEEETKQLKVEVYDLRKNNVDVFAEIKKQYGQMKTIKSDGNGGDLEETDGEIDSLSFGTIREVKSLLDDMKSNMERLQIEKEALEEELIQARQNEAFNLGANGE